MLADAVSPPGTPSFSLGGAASSFGFKSFEQVDKSIFGEFSNGARAVVNFAMEGTNLNVAIRILTKVAAETLRNIENGALNAGKASGASTVTIIGGMVKDKIAPLLG